MKTNTLFALMFVLLASQNIRAQEKHWSDGFILKGFASASFGYNLNNPEDQQIGYRVFDKRSNSFMLDVVELSIIKEPAGTGAAGMRVDLVAGGTIPRTIHSSGMFENQDVDLKQAYVSYVAPIGSGLKLDFGKFVTHFGYELIDGNDGYNDNATRSFTFGYTIPFTHTGLRAGYKVCDRVSAMLMVVNGCDNAIDNNKSKSIGAQVAVAPVEPLSLYANFMYGPDGTNNNSDNTTVMNLVGTYTVAERIKIGADVVLGSLDNGAVSQTGEPEAASWMGVAGYLRYTFNEWFSLSFRGEQMNDKDGIRTGYGKELTLTSMTLTPEFRAGDTFVFRFDVRMDSANEKVFGKEHDANEEAFSDSQTTVTLNMLYLLP